MKDLTIRYTAGGLTLDTSAAELLASMKFAETRRRKDGTFRIFLYRQDGRYWWVWKYSSGKMTVEPIAEDTARGTFALFHIFDKEERPPFPQDPNGLCPKCGRPVATD